MFRLWKRRDAPKTVMIFDFDGTIADTMSETVRVYNSFADRYGYKKVGEKDIEKFRGKGPKEILKWLDISLFVLPFVIKSVKREMRKDMSHLKTTVSIRGAITKLKRMGFRVGILTTNSKENVLPFLKKNRLEVFDFIYAGGSVFGKHKMLKRALREIKARPEEAVYIGDEVRDIEAAKRRDVSIISVAWGYNNAAALKKRKPDYLVRTPAQLLSVAKKIRKSA